ncbi:cytochrome c oxidase subunit II [Capillimicrobium parvum]|uniref:Cytochrome c oxidase subunit 2 n=1 Tax=Capillimicrobium parvum TaxID=2884022 RepID=A0A9E7C342_9ACTN|nr:cytochrome c oxidase subunit II [Capillimicrobium parvum]UGS38369.1 Cytochrome c oxidase subunit 2 [Capillimicrobium parvum]
MVDTREQYGGLASLYLPIAIAIFVLVVVVFAVFLWRFRREREPSRTSEHMTLELVWVGIVAAIVVVLVIATFRVESRVDAVAPRPALAVHVEAAKWNWRFTYPDGRTREAELVVPAGRTIRFDAVSLDVLHDFWVPDLRFQRQVWPDHTERFDLVFPHPGRYQGVCAWFCGLRHQNMHFTVRAVDQAAFDRFLGGMR